MKACYLTPLSPTITMMKTEPIKPVMEKTTTPIDAINNLITPASFQILCFNLEEEEADEAEQEER